MMKRKNITKSTESTNCDQTMTLGKALFCSETHIEINGNYEAIIEGCKGILSYREEEIRLNTENGQLKLRGRNLQIICMGEASMIVRGYIIGTEYDN